MKRSIQPITTNRRKPDHHRRRGAIFHYYLMYTLLASILLSTAGFSIHMILEADEIDRRVSQQLKTLLRLDHQMRSDFTNRPSCQVQQSSLNVMTGDGYISWKLNANRLSREEHREDALYARENFVFPAGTEITWATSDGFLTITLLEAPFRISGKRATSAAPMAIEIVLAMDSASEAEQTAEVPQEAAE